MRDIRTLLPSQALAELESEIRAQMLKLAKSSVMAGINIYGGLADYLRVRVLEAVTQASGEAAQSDGFRRLYDAAYQACVQDPQLVAAIRETHQELLLKEMGKA